MVDRATLDAVEPVVGALGQVEQVEAILDQGDEGHEPVALQAVLVEVVGAAGRGSDNDDAGVEQALEQAAQNHRVGDVDDVELVEAEQESLPRKRRRDRHQRIVGAALARRLQAVLHLQQEGVEMHAALLGDRRAGEEQVHQHGLAAPDRPEHVQALGRRLLAAAAEARLPAGAPIGRGRPVAAQGVVQALQLLAAIAWQGSGRSVPVAR